MIKLSLRYTIITALADWLLVATDKLDDWLSSAQEWLGDWLSSAQEWLDEHSLRQYHADLDTNIRRAIEAADVARYEYETAESIRKLALQDYAIKAQRVADLEALARWVRQ